MLNTANYQPESTGWFTSTRTNNGNQCVEVRFDGAVVLIRDSKFRRDPERRLETEPVITVTAPEWMSFLGVVLGCGTDPVDLTARLRPDGHTELRHGEITLVYTPGEWDAFLAGAQDGEFNRVPVRLSGTSAHS
ncbi:DUF397 domain-containing protein [Nocardia inohanensis]|uniref:DUF397 domain-containing protein n=1 Tax=Nocardia inohanensis TaxID=209246 RepID=UPI000830F22F|nr:DUF397 domain-containing protein [Nocardia inohanensis]